MLKKSTKMTLGIWVTFFYKMFYSDLAILMDILLMNSFICVKHEGKKKNVMLMIL